MAMEKQYAGGRHPMVDQDAAITDYLDGLLRDPDGVEPPSPAPTRTRRAPGLKVINVAESVEDGTLAESAPEPADEAAADQPLPEAAPPVAAKVPVSPSDVVALEPTAVAEEMPGNAEEPADEAIASASVNADDEAAVPETVAVGDAAIEEGSESEQVEGPDESVGVEETSLGVGCVSAAC